jgi:hypothetical protein
VKPHPQTKSLTSSHSTESNQQDSRLLRLPAEIRNTIYKYTLRDETIRIKLQGTMRPSRSNHSSTALLQTCRQIRYEARSILYSQATFFCGYHHLTPGNLNSLGAKAIQAIQSLRLSYQLIWFLQDQLHHHQATGRPGREPISITAKREQLARLSKLKHVHVHIPFKQWLQRFAIATFVTDFVLKDMNVQVHIHEDDG